MPIGYKRRCHRFSSDGVCILDQWGEGAERAAMMPLFPSPPLRFRAAGSPRHGFKAGMSETAFPSPDSACICPSRRASGFSTTQ